MPGRRPLLDATGTKEIKAQCSGFASDGSPRFRLGQTGRPVRLRSFSHVSGTVSFAWMDRATEGTWLVTGYRTSDDIAEIATPLPEGPAPFLVVDGDSVYGSTGVNRFRGKLEAGVITGPLATTRMAGTAEMTRQEEVLLRHLADADSIEVGEKGMILSRDGLSLIELRRSGTDDAGRSS